MTNGTLDDSYVLKIQLRSTDAETEEGTPITVIIPSVLVPVVVLILLCCFCYWLNKKSPDIISAKPQTYQDFSRVDESTMLRMSGEIVENEISNDSLHNDDTRQNTDCSTGNQSYEMQDMTGKCRKDKEDISSIREEELNHTKPTNHQNGKDNVKYVEINVTS